MPTPVAVAFFPSSLRTLGYPHVGLVRGSCLIDSRIGHGIQHRELDAKPTELHWLDDELGELAWSRAWMMVGQPYVFCTSFVCACLGGTCQLPDTLRGML